MKLEHIVPWGRSLDEYRRMFSVTSGELGLSILGCGDGPASFNAEISARGGAVVSVDPLYRWSRGAIQQRIAAVADTVIDQVKLHRERYTWTHFPSPEALYQKRMEAMSHFLADYDAGRRTLRYVPAALPDLPFRPGQFDLVLCSHLLFTYSEHLDETFHYRAIRAMLAAGRDVRIFPVVTLAGQCSGHLSPVCERLKADGFETQRTRVDYEFQRGANEMLRILH